MARYYEPGGSTHYDLNNLIRVRWSRGTQKTTNKLIIETTDEEFWVRAGDLKVDENARLNLWVKYGDIDPATDTPVFSGFVTRAGISKTAGSSKITVNVVDAIYVMLNKVWARNYENWRAPDIVIDIVKSVSDKGNGEFYVNADLKSNGGYVEDTRSDSSQFPQITLALGIKPVYEWLREVSSITSLNSSAELDAAATGTGTLPEPRPFLFWIDENNNFHWERSSLTPVSTIDVSKSMNYEIGKSSEDSFNHVIYTIESDLNGNTIYGHVLAEDITGPLKQVHIPMNWIAKHAPDSVKIDNATFVSYCKRKAESVALKLLAEYGRYLFSATLTLDGNEVQSYMYGVGSVYTISHPSGFRRIMRLKQIGHSVSKNGWTATLNFAEDPEDISKYLQG